MSLEILEDNTKNHSGIDTSAIATLTASVHNFSSLFPPTLPSPNQPHSIVGLLNAYKKIFCTRSIFVMQGYYYTAVFLISNIMFVFQDLGVLASKFYIWRLSPAGQHAKFLYANYHVFVLGFRSVGVRVLHCDSSFQLGNIRSFYMPTIMFLFQDLGVLASEFYILTALSSWATCNPKGAPSKEEPPANHQKDNSFETTVSQEQHPAPLGTQEIVKEKKLMEKWVWKTVLVSVNSQETNFGPDLLCLSMLSNVMIPLSWGSLSKGWLQVPISCAFSRTFVDLDLSFSVPSHCISASRPLIVTAVTQFTTSASSFLSLFSRYTRLNLSAQYREEVGRKAKQVLDYGRIQYLRTEGFQANLVLYVTQESTPENVALLARRAPR